MRDLINIVLNEGKDAPLFHGTEINAACHIIADGAIDAYQQYEHNPKGVSLTRDYTTAFGFGTYWERSFPVVMVFDQQRLVRSPLKIVPRRDTYDSGTVAPHEAEEMVLGDLPLEPYLISINITPEEIDRAMNGQFGKDYLEYLQSEGWPQLTEEMWRANLERLARHPKLNRWVPRIEGQLRSKLDYY